MGRLCFLATWPRCNATSELRRALRLCSARYPAYEYTSARHSRETNPLPCTNGQRGRGTNPPRRAAGCAHGHCGARSKGRQGPAGSARHGGASSPGDRNRAAHEDKGDEGGGITKKAYVCTYCNKPIPNADVLIGKLALRKRGARGLGREVVLALHPACSERLTDSTAAPPVRAPRAKRAVEKPAAAAKKP